MMTIRPAERQDIEAFTGHAVVNPTVLALAGVDEAGKVLGVGGLAYVAGRVVAFCDVADAARAHPVALHKAALSVLKLARERRHRFVYATPDASVPAARRWLERLGFDVSEDGALAVWRL